MRRPQQRHKPRISQFERPPRPHGNFAFAICTSSERDDRLSDVGDDVVPEDILQLSSFGSGQGRPQYPRKIRPSLDIRKHRCPIGWKGFSPILVTFLKHICGAVVHEGGDGLAGHVIVSVTFRKGWRLSVLSVS